MIAIDDTYLDVSFESRAPSQSLPIVIDLTNVEIESPSSRLRIPSVGGGGDGSIRAKVLVEDDSSIEIIAMEDLTPSLPRGPASSLSTRSQRKLPCRDSTPKFYDLDEDDNSDGRGGPYPSSYVVSQRVNIISRGDNTTKDAPVIVTNDHMEVDQADNAASEDDEGLLSIRL